MSSRAPANIDIKPDVLRKRLRPVMIANVILADMGSCVPVLLQCFRKRDGFRSHVLGLFGRNELSLFFRESRLPAIATQAADDIDVVVDPCRVLPRQHRRARRRTIRLRVGVREAKSIIGQFLQVGRLEFHPRRPHRRLLDTDLVPPEIIHHAGHNVRPCRQTLTQRLHIG